MKSPLNTSRPARILRHGFLTTALTLGLPPHLASAELVAWWDFNQPVAYNRSVDLRAGLAARVLGGAAITGDAEGRSGSAGDRAARFGVASQRLHLTDASYFTSAASGNVMSVSFWIKQVTVRNATMLSFVAPSVGGRGFQAHSPWGNNIMYFGFIHLVTF